MIPSLDAILEQSAALHSELGALWLRLELPESNRGKVVVGYCSIVCEHVISQQHLFAIGHHVTALTLVRPTFESLVRAIWCLQGASDDWIEKFLTSPATDADPRKETHTGPPVDSMLETIQRHHPEFVHRSLVELKEATWQPMHSYVHGGIRPVLQALVGLPEPQQISAIRNGNGFAVFATNVLLMNCKGPAGFLQPIQMRYNECLPPTSRC